jgi:N-carbamoylputrescine amidase
MGDPTAERERQRGAWRTVQRAHALAKGIPLLNCNRVGFEAAPHADAPGIRCRGGSFACGPQREWLARAGEQAAT